MHEDFLRPWAGKEMSCKYDKVLRTVTDCTVTTSEQSKSPRAAALPRPLWTGSVLENE